jgi:exonuclease SbcC
MKPISLQLKGFKGIKAGMGLDEICLDFSALPAGVIVFSAPNGTGKTTIMDNLHPYRLMPFRAGSYSPKAFSFYDHTYGEAAREFIFSLSGCVYRSLIVIEAAKKKQEAYLHRRGQGEESWEPLNDGKVETYDDAVEELIGSPELFFMSVFRAQNAKSLTAYSKGDMKSILTELFGIDYLKALSEKAGMRKTQQQQVLLSLRSEKQILGDTVSRKGTVEVELLQVAAQTHTLRTGMDELESSLSAARGNLSAIDADLAGQQELLLRKKEAEEDITRRKEKLAAYATEQEQRAGALEEKVFGISKKISDSRALLESLPKLREVEQEKVSVEGALKIAKESLRAADQEYTTLQSRVAAQAERKQRLKEREGQHQKLCLERSSKVNLTRFTLEALLAERNKLHNAPCGGQLAESCEFVKSAVIEINKIPQLEEQLDELCKATQEEVELDFEISNLRMEISAAGDMSTQAKETLAKKQSLQARVSDLEDKVNLLRENLADLPKVALAEKELPLLQKELTSLEQELDAVLETAEKRKQADVAEIASLEEKAAAMKCDNREELLLRRKEVEEVITKTKKEKQDIAGQQEATAVRKGSLEADARRIAEAELKLRDVTAKEATLSCEISEWSLLEKALGNEGLIALEISDAGPQITAYANELLKVIGGRFSVKIETQFLKAKGGMKEGFDIIVYDARTDEAKSLKLLSGGEKTWVEEAITRAICLHRASSSGIHYECIFSDEKDGALDPEKKKEFFDMKQRVLELGGYVNEFCITQTDSLLSRADAVIELENYMQ